VIEGRTGKGGPDALLQLAGSEQAGGLDDAALAMDPLRPDRVEPGTLDRREAGDEPPPTIPVDLLIMGP
jgi:hypothetical protein